EDVTDVRACLGDDGAVVGRGVLRERAGVDAGLDGVEQQQAPGGVRLRDRQRQPQRGPAVVLADDDVLGDVDETTGEVTGVGGRQRGFGTTRAGRDLQTTVIG